MTREPAVDQEDMPRPHNVHAGLLDRLLNILPPFPDLTRDRHE